jgi:tripartite-type tricarboxylate transporter receptor subunit TctC
MRRRALSDRARWFLIFIERLQRLVKGGRRSHAMRTTVIRLIAALLLTAVANAPPARAQDWPDRPVKIIVPFGAGGSGDTLARVVAEHLSATFKQQFVVENRTGAGGAIGAAAIASAAPDGTTIGITNLSILALVPAINTAVSYHPVESFTHIAYIAGAPVALAATPASGIKTLKDFIATAAKSAKEGGRPLTFASSGVGSDGHLVGVAISLATGVPLEHVPYRSTSQALTDVVAGHVALCTFTLSSTAQFLRGGQLNGVAVTSPERMPDQPELPTFKELGYSTLVGTTWFSLSGPPKLAHEIVERLNAEVTRIVALPDVQARFRRDGFIAQPMSPAEFTRYVGEEVTRWKPLVDKAGLAGKGG